jgi:hypothetical protein
MSDQHHPGGHRRQHCDFLCCASAAMHQQKIGRSGTVGLLGSTDAAVCSAASVCQTKTAASFKMPLVCPVSTAGDHLGLFEADHVIVNSGVPTAAAAGTQVHLSLSSIRATSGLQQCPPIRQFNFGWPKVGHRRHVAIAMLFFLVTHMILAPSLVVGSPAAENGKF